jgi:hypothetical protein
MELSYSEAVSSSAAQELPNILWKPKINYCDHDRNLLVPNLCHSNPVHTTPCYFYKIIFILSSNLYLGFFIRMYLYFWLPKLYALPMSSSHT